MPEQIDYKIQQAAFWTAEEILLRDDLTDWNNKLNDNEEIDDRFNENIYLTSNDLINFTNETFNRLQNSNLIGFNSTLVDFKSIITSNVFIISSSNYTNTHTCTYQKFFPDSEILIQADFPYKINGFGSDHYCSRLMISSDIDEIPDRNNLKVGNLEQDLYYYNLETKLDISWRAAAIIEYKELKKYDSIQNFRVGNNLPTIKSGWHFSFFGNEEFIANKIRNYSHQEYNTEKHTNLDFIKKCISEKSDLFLREININSIQIKDNDYLPINYKMLL